MLDRAAGFHAGAALERRQTFCKQNGADYSKVVYQAIRYDDRATYDVVREVGRSDTTASVADVAADALITREPGVGLFLPVADCAATVLYDPRQRILGLLHMGRHSTLSELIPTVLHRFRQLGSAPDDVLVWMSPHAQRASYHLAWFDHADDPAWVPYVDRLPEGYAIDMAGYNTARLVQGGIAARHIVVSSVDTLRDSNYFSHAAGDTGGRMAVLAYMR